MITSKCDDCSYQLAEVRTDKPICVYCSKDHWSLTPIIMDDYGNGHNALWDECKDYAKKNYSRGHRARIPMVHDFDIVSKEVIDDAIEPFIRTLLMRLKTEDIMIKSPFCDVIEVTESHRENGFGHVRRYGKVYITKDCKYFLGGDDFINTCLNPWANDIQVI